MIVHIGPDAPLVIRATADGLLVAHIAAAFVGLLSGSVAILARKGGRTHRIAGVAFTWGMLTMGGVAAVTAPLIPQWVSAFEGLFIVYLTATGWMALKRPPGQVGGFERWAPAVGAAVAAGFLGLAARGLGAPDGRIYGEPFQVVALYGVAALVAVVCDLRMLHGGGLVGGRRLARHLWRLSMVLALVWSAVAVPKAVRVAPFLVLPTLIVLAMMIRWLVRLAPRRPVRPVPSSSIAAA